jgi:hypothetical protein
VESGPRAAGAGGFDDHLAAAGHGQGVELVTGSLLLVRLAACSGIPGGAFSIATAMFPRLGLAVTSGLLFTAHLRDSADMKTPGAF